MNTLPSPPKGNPDLYEHAKEMVKEAYKKPQWNGERWKKALGHCLQSMFETRSVWTLKDLTDEQLLLIMGKAHKIIERKTKREHDKTLHLQEM